MNLRVTLAFGKNNSTCSFKCNAYGKTERSSRRKGASTNTKLKFRVYATFLQVQKFSSASSITRKLLSTEIKILMPSTF